MTVRVMPHKSELTDSTSVLPSLNALASSGESKSAFPTRVVCDLAQGGTFSHRYDRPHVPVIAAFGGDCLHQFGMSGAWDLEHAVSENSPALFRSRRKFFPEGNLKKWNDLTFKFGPRSFLYADDTRIVGYAETPDEAEQLVAKFNRTYGKAVAPTGGSFYLITTGKEIGLETVALGAETVLGDDDLNLRYACVSQEWHQDFAKSLRTKNYGLSIFEGAPGTGKTSYLRHLMGVLKESHRFYFIPPATVEVLSDPQFIGFWANERRRHADRKFVVILEDSDAALMTRGTENREQVSAILNLSDGMLADFLRLQIICTINCRAADIDQALLRPGRLLCHHVFRRLITIKRPVSPKASARNSPLCVIIPSRRSLRETERWKSSVRESVLLHD